MTSQRKRMSPKQYKEWTKLEEAQIKAEYELHFEGQCSELNGNCIGCIQEESLRSE